MRCLESSSEGGSESSTDSDGDTSSGTGGRLNGGNRGLGRLSGGGDGQLSGGEGTGRGRAVDRRGAVGDVPLGSSAGRGVDDRDGSAGVAERAARVAVSARGEGERLGHGRRDGVGNILSGSEAGSGEGDNGETHLDGWLVLVVSKVEESRFG